MTTVIPKDMEDIMLYQNARLNTIRAKIKELEIEKRVVLHNIAEITKLAQSRNEEESRDE